MTRNIIGFLLATLIKKNNSRKHLDDKKLTARSINIMTCTQQMGKQTLQHMTPVPIEKLLI